MSTKSEKRLSLLEWIGLAGLAACGLAGGDLAVAYANTAAQGVGEALSRPALQASHPGNAMLLGAAKAGTRLVTVGERGLILLSDDQGKNWRQAASPVSVTLTAVRFLDKSRGIAVGHGGTILTTADGGEHWTVRMDGRKAAAIVLQAAKVSGKPEAVANAERLMADGPDKPFFDVLALSDAHLMVIGAYGLALESQDGGQTWQSWMDRLDNPKGLHYYALRRNGDTFLIAGEQGMLQVSNDGGKTFTRVASPYKGSFFTAELPGAQDFVVAGLRGNVWRSHDGGQSWSQLDNPIAASITGSTVQADGRLVLCNQAGMLLSPEGEQLQTMKTSPLPALNGILPMDGNQFAVLTSMGTVIVDSHSDKQVSK
jgi:photosystem II stability/assembly factor-like uncharacterized protein